MDIKTSLPLTNEMPLTFQPSEAIKRCRAKLQRCDHMLNQAVEALSDNVASNEAQRKRQRTKYEFSSPADSQRGAIQLGFTSRQPCLSFTLVRIIRLFAPIVWMRRDVGVARMKMTLTVHSSWEEERAVCDLWAHLQNLSCLRTSWSQCVCCVLIIQSVRQKPVNHITRSRCWRLSTSASAFSSTAMHHGTVACLLCFCHEATCGKTFLFFFYEPFYIFSNETINGFSSLKNRICSQSNWFFRTFRFRICIVGDSEFLHN